MYTYYDKEIKTQAHRIFQFLVNVKVIRIKH